MGSGSGSRLGIAVSGTVGGGKGPPLPAAGSGDVGATVRHELATSPRTWHLPQPGVTVQGDRVVLTGAVPHDEARLALIRTAGAVTGVRAVDDHLTIDEPPTP